METADLLALCLASLPPVRPATLWQAWVLAPETLIPLLILLFVPRYLWGSHWVVDRQARGAWLLGWCLLALALVSPLCRLAATTASGHMLQHVVLILLAPLPLAIALARALQGRWRPRALLPSGATLLFGTAIWLAHVPFVYQAALQGTAAHLALLALLLASALLFWTTALAAGGLQALGMIFVTMTHSGLLGALLTFSPSLLYPVFGAGPAIWGLAPLEDQQLAGLIMWVPMGLGLLAAGLWVGGRGLLWSVGSAR